MNNVLNIKTKKVAPQVVVTVDSDGRFMFKHNLPPDLLVAFLLDAASSLVKQQQKEKSGQPLIWKPTGMKINAV